MIFRRHPVRTAVAVLAVLLIGGCGSAQSSGNQSSGNQSPGSRSAAAPAGSALAAVPTGAPGTTTWAPWPGALHDARHSGASATAGPQAGTVRWRRRLEAGVTPGPVVGADGTVYAASDAGVLHALDPTSGADRWTYDAHRSAGGDLSTSPLVLPDGTLLWGPPAGNELLALSAAGALLWTLPLPGRPTSPASADGHRIYVGDSSGGVSAVDVSGGAHRLVWTVDVGSTSYGSVVTAGSGRIYTTADAGLVAVDDRGGTGAVAWRADPGDDITEVSAGLAPDGTALLGTNGGREWAYDRAGRLRWSAPRMITYSSPAVTATGLAYVADHAGVVHVFDVRDGSEAASYRPAMAQIWSSVVVDRDYRAYFGTQLGHLYGVDAHGATLFDLDLGAPLDAYPALTADGALVVGTQDGTLAAIG